jgi:subtilisin family serine protease
VSADYAQSGVLQIVPKNGKDARAIAARLNRSSAVWSAYVAPRPVPAGAPDGTSGDSRNFEPAQGYLHSAPHGIGAMEAWATPGATGQGVTVCDIEGNWNLSHEDLPSGIPLIGGTVIDDLGWRNHGTAVLGEMVARRGAIGCVGIVPDAKAVVHSAIVGGVFNTAAAINGAAASLGAGDVILIELQATGPNGKYVAMQYWDDVFSAIVAATAKGIVVVEAAGNGDENFDLPVFAGTGLQKLSGAIVVGAGIPPTNFRDHFDGYTQIGVPRSRIWFSNHGKIVDVQGWGWHVTTLGYGDAQGGASENRWYTHRFSGTSSASPIVTGAVASLQGVARARLGAPLTPARLRSLLLATGASQAAGPGVPRSQRIGRLPNLPATILKI